ncbi:MAG: bifunctional 4-hydroxy-2-oxoglutarate aldolase/2-dehydro-3-deoxy-phosphogluconate aldolase [Opitutales bacterium]|nr:bifunctional 4-hydroxy-2-oxoglutarate aldolase/2-dehydro-3-deoxy-phosphogluconate aldolase [Opitutales bacterium]
MFTPEIVSALEEARIVAVLTLEDPALAPDLGRALLAGGVRVVELTLRTDRALESLVAMRSACPDLIIGAGTVLTPDQVRAVKAAGAAFGVAPGCNPRILSAAVAAGLPFAPGVCTPTDIEQALEAGCTEMKFFPAGTSGGLPHLRAIAAPFAHRRVRFIPLGGLTLENAPDYLREPSVLALGGSWIAPAKTVAAKDWSTIEANARAAANLV